MCYSEATNTTWHVGPKLRIQGFHAILELTSMLRQVKDHVGDMAVGGLAPSRRNQFEKIKQMYSEMYENVLHLTK